MIPLIGQHFMEKHDFRLPAIMQDGSLKSDFVLSDYIEGKFAVIMFYTMDFSYVCASEMLAIKNRIKQFQKLNTEVIAINGDSYLSHEQWQKLPFNQGGIGDMPFIMCADMSRKITNEFGVLVNDSLAMPATFIIDDKGYFRYQLVHDMSIGRNMDEIIRLLCALQTQQHQGNLIPASWRPGEDTLPVDKAALSAFLQKNEARL